MAELRSFYFFLQRRVPSSLHETARGAGGPLSRETGAVRSRCADAAGRRRGARAGAGRAGGAASARRLRTRRRGPAQARRVHAPRTLGAPGHLLEDLLSML